VIAQRLRLRLLLLRLGFCWSRAVSHSCALTAFRSDSYKILLVRCISPQVCGGVDVVRPTKAAQWRMQAQLQLQAIKQRLFFVACAFIAICLFEESGALISYTNFN